MASLLRLCRQYVFLDVLFFSYTNAGRCFFFKSISFPIYGPLLLLVLGYTPQLHSVQPFYVGKHVVPICKCCCCV